MKWQYGIILGHCRMSFHWRHNDHNGVSNHQPHGCLLNRLFRRRSRKTSKLRVTGLCVGNSPGPVNSPHKGPVTRKMFPFDDVIMYFKRATPTLSSSIQYFMYSDGDGTVLHSGGLHKPAEGFSLNYNSNKNRLDFRVKDADTYYFSQPPVSTNFWLHPVFSWQKGSNIRAYINGCPDNTTHNQTRSEAMTDNYPLSIGLQWAGNQNTADMILDDLNVWYSVLSVNEMRRLYFYGDWVLWFVWLYKYRLGWSADKQNWHGTWRFWGTMQSLPYQWCVKIYSREIWRGKEVCHLAIL